MSASKLLDDMALAAKGWYGQSHMSANALLCIFQQWTGTKASTYRNMLSVVMPEFVSRPCFKSASPERQAEIILSLVGGTSLDQMLDRQYALGLGGLPLHPDPIFRAARALFSALAGSRSDLIFINGKPEIDEEIRAYLDDQHVAHVTT